MTYIIGNSLANNKMYVRLCDQFSRLSHAYIKMRRKIFDAKMKCGPRYCRTCAIIIIVVEAYKIKFAKIEGTSSGAGGDRSRRREQKQCRLCVIENRVVIVEWPRPLAAGRVVSTFKFSLESRLSNVWMKKHKKISKQRATSCLRCLPTN